MIINVTYIVKILGHTGKYKENINHLILIQMEPPLKFEHIFFLDLQICIYRHATCFLNIL